METTRKAGALILNNIGMFNESVIHFGNVIEPKILLEIDNKISKLAEDKKWIGQFYLSDKEDCWIAPENWKIPEENGDPSAKAWFFISAISAEEDYWMAAFCGFGKKGGEAGFIFNVDRQHFNGRNRWNQAMAKLDSSLIKELAENDFRNLGKGSFFLPIRLDAAKLASAWEDEQKDFEEALEPFDEAFKKLQQAQPIFDKIIQFAEQAAKG